MSSQVPGPAASASSTATLVLILGLLGLMGSLGSCCCCLFALLGLCAPVAWFLGHKELAAIREGRSSAVGESSAKVGMVCGIVGTVLLGLYLIGILIYIGLVGVGAATELLKHPGVPLSR